MKKQKLSAKLIGGFIFMALMLLGGGSMGVFGINLMESDLHDVSDVHFPGIYNVGVMNEAQINIKRVSSALLATESFGKAGEREQLLKNLDEAWQRAEKGWKNYDTLQKTKEAEVIWNNLKPQWETWRKNHNEFVALVKGGKKSEASALFAGVLSGSFNKTEELLRKLSEMDMMLAAEARESGNKQASRMKISALIGTVIGFIIAIVLGIYFSRTITVPVNRLIANLTETSAQFAEAANQISISSNHLAEGTSVQASATEEVSAVTVELKISNQKVTDNVNALKNLYENSAVSGMAVFDYQKKTKKTLKQVKKSSEDTAEIVKGIEKIAFQTNLLALSASVEAAHAGESGTGFVVVASEVRGLGDRSTEAAKKTSALIDQTIGIATSGSNFVDISTRKFVDYGTRSFVLGPFTEEAAKVAQKQNEGVGHINASIVEISKSAQTNAASSEESASVAEETTAQAMFMKSIVEELAQVVGYKRLG
jgi:methyl-accepting chemotaxis protein